MNILFVSYADFTANSLGHIAVFAGELVRLGHVCAVAVPENPESIAVIQDPHFRPIVFFRALAGEIIFADGHPPALIHAWTPREGVRKFVLTYQSRAPRARLIIHLEDNEDFLMEAYSGMPLRELQALPEKSLRKLISPRLAHPHRYRKFLSQAQGITYITERLGELSLAGLPRHLLLPGVNTSLFNANPTPSHSKILLGLQPDERLVVYTGSATFANLEDLRTLLVAITLINEQGTPCKLVRTGLNPPSIAAELAHLSRDHVIDLGFIDKNKIPSLIASADVLVQPGAPDDFNDYRLPSKIPEFLACGRPTIIPRANIGRHMIDGQHALLLETGSAEEMAAKCLRVFHDQALSNRLSMGALEFARTHFDLERNTQGLLNFYEEVLKNRNSLRLGWRSPPLLNNWARASRQFLWPHLYPENSRQAERVIEVEYMRWLKRCDSPSSVQSKTLRTLISALSPNQQALITILMPVHDPEEHWLERAIRSVQEQVYPHWELCIADDASRSPHIRKLLIKKGRADPRIKIVFRERNGHISAASNSALTLATGRFLTLLDHDDELHPDALAEIAVALCRQPELDLIYSDRDKIDEQGKRFSPYFKPDWNPDLLLAQNYFCHLTVFRTDRLRRLGGFREGYEGSQDWDLALRYTDGLPAEKIYHISRVLYHWRAIPGSTAFHIDDKENYPHRAAERALGDHLKRTSVSGELLSLSGKHWRIKHVLPANPPLVSIVFNTNSDVTECLREAELFSGSVGYPNIEVIVAFRAEKDAPVSEIRTLNKIKLLTCDSGASFIVLANRAAASANGSILIFASNLVTPISPDWLSELVSQTLRPEVSAAGGLVCRSSGTVRHAGYILEKSAILNSVIPIPAFTGETPDAGIYFNRLGLVQNFSALGFETLTMRRELFTQHGGFDEKFSGVDSAAIDLCLRLGEAGQRMVWTPFARFEHRDNTPPRFSPLDLARLTEKWGHRDHDPAYNRNLALYGGGFSLAFPPR